VFSGGNTNRGVEMKDNLKVFGNVLLRIVAVFTASGLTVIGAGAIAGISTIKAIFVVGLTAVAAVTERLARDFINDGKLTTDEINEAFAPFEAPKNAENDVVN
jgi:hypothetical protein